MKAKVQTLTAAAVLGLALFSNSIPAWAGSKSTREVDLGSAAEFSYAGGNMRGARYSADSRQYIGCSFSNTNGPFVMCLATDQTGKSSFCTSTNSEVAAVVKTITDFSRIYFEMPLGSASCRFLVVENGSQHLR